MTSGTENQIVSAIESAEEIRDPLIAETLGQKPRLLIEDCNPDRTVAALRDTLAAADGLYDRGVPVRLAFDQIQQGTVAQVMTPDALVLMAHAVCRPYVLKAKPDGTVSEVNARQGPERGQPRHGGQGDSSLRGFDQVPLAAQVPCRAGGRIPAATERN